MLARRPIRVSMSRRLTFLAVALVALLASAVPTFAIKQKSDSTPKVTSFSPTKPELGGNLTLQPGFRGLRHRIAGPLPNADRITAGAIWVGCHPALDDAMVDWTAESIADFLKIH